MTTPKSLNDIFVLTDGGARGNPGAAACAFVIKIPDKSEIIFQEGEFLGISTNNKAEYRGIINALTWLTKNLDILSKGSKISFFSDSELVVRQLNGIYRIKDSQMLILYSRVQGLITELKEQRASAITFTHFPRSQNSDADLLVNQTLDRI
jgi:ribonuclease HI